MLSDHTYSTLCVATPGRQTVVFFNLQPSGCPVRGAYCGLAGVIIDGNDVRTGRAGAGAVGQTSHGHHPSLRQRFSVCH
jgi:hypothetical protein